jgi:quercetin dioxygenase-like cupin family protein
MDRRRFMELTGAVFAASAGSTTSQAQSTGPRLTLVLRRDLEGQGQVVQESVVNIAEFAPGMSAPWHMHPGAQEILYVQEGTLTVEVEGRELTVVNAGRGYIIPADTPHLARNDSSGAMAKAVVIHSRSAREKPLVVPVRKS